MQEDFVLKVENLSAFYNLKDKKRVLDKISFNLRKNEVLCLCGPNGSGKSTLLSSILNLVDNGLCFSKNSIFLGDENLSVENLKREEIAKRICLMSQNENCQWNYSVFDFIKFARFIYKDENSSYANSLVNSVIKELEIENLAGKSVNAISGGEFQKVRIARSLVQETQILLLDEAISNLDYEYQFKILKKLKEICKKTNRSVIISIHDLNIASIFADRILLLGKYEFNQQKKYIGSPKEILKNSILKEIYKTEIETFVHPEYKVNQIFLK